MFECVCPDGQCFYCIYSELSYINNFPSWNCSIFAEPNDFHFPGCLIFDDDELPF